MGALDADTAMRAAAQVGDRLDGLPGVADVSEPVSSPSGSTPDGTDDTGNSAVLVNIELDPGFDDVGGLQEITDEVADDYPSLRIEQAGWLSANVAIDDRVADDLARAEVTSVPVTLGLMLIAFGALTAAGIPVLLAGTSVAATIGISAPLSYVVGAEPTVASMIVLIGMAVGVDYSLFYLKREREERARGHSTLDAVEIAAETSGHAIMVSGAAVMVSLAGLYAVGSATFNSLATGAIVVVAVAVLGSITVLPALLVKLGRWVDRPRVPLLWRLKARLAGSRSGASTGGISARILGPVVRRPLAALLLATVAVGLMAAPAMNLRIHSSNLATLPSDIPEVAALKRLAELFPSEGTTVDVVVHAGPDRRADVTAALADLEREAVSTNRFSVSDSQARVSADGRTRILTLGIPAEEADPAVDLAIRQLREELAPGVLQGTGAEFAVGGEAAESMDFADRQTQRMPIVIGLVLLLTMVMMLLAFGSVPVALASTVLNLLSVAMTFGVLTWVFQDGHLSGLLGFDSPGFVIDWIPLFVLVVLVGLSMDYHVFVLSRVRELAGSGVPAREAVRRGVSESAPTITSAAAVMVSVFAIFATLSLMELKMIGVGLSVAILIDATVIRLVMLPAVLVLLGDRAWPQHPPEARGAQLVLPDTNGRVTTS